MIIYHYFYHSLFIYLIIPIHLIEFLSYIISGSTSIFSTLKVLKNKNSYKFAAPVLNSDLID